MIRGFRPADMQAVLDIWLQASIVAHDFIDAAFWRDQVEAMRTIYLPSSKSIVFEQDSRLLGFYAMYETTLAALFVAPAYQGTGIGSQLLTHAKHCHTQITLSVYTENQKSLAFYRKHGFQTIKEQPDIHTGHAERILEWRA
ncbi:MAG: N-acetyltransferase [Desulfovibrionales bacterium]|nr:N-acetyltransferase [Desulfovibrionales bacterium]